MQVVDEDCQFVHGAGNLDNSATLSFVITIDAEKKHIITCPPDDLEQGFSEALRTEHCPCKPPVLKKGLMPERDAATDAAVEAVADASDIRGFLMMVISGLRAVNKGCPSAYTALNEAIELFMYKAERRRCRYFRKVVEAMQEYLRLRGYDCIRIRYHINWKDFLKDFFLEHGLHWDSINTCCEMHEAKMLRAVAVVDIPYSAEK